jgi:hypothetical protein
LLVGIFAALAFSPDPAVAAETPNIVIVFTDDKEYKCC